MAEKTPITIARGDGIGPEIMDATLRILEAAGARFDIEEIEIGEQVYLRGNPAGIEPGAYESLRRTRVFLKAPITTPQGGGYKSLNVTTRKAFGLYANVRPCMSYYPFVRTKHPVLDVVIIRENEEDLYAGIEHRQTHEVYQCLKLMTRPGTEKIVRYAFEYALANNRKKVTCFTKDNIMKMTDGMFHKVFEEIGQEYPTLEKEHWIVDIGSAKLADTPEIFDVLVLPNLYGDILSDVTAQIAGSVGLAGSANIGDGCAMFEAIHGSAPKHAGKNTANPSGLFLGSILMLVHIGQADVAEKAHNAWLKTLEDGIHTRDIFKADTSKEQVGTQEFANAVIARLGQKPAQLKAASYKAGEYKMNLKVPSRDYSEKKETIGLDVFIHWGGATPQEVGKRMEECAGPDFKVNFVSNRGLTVYPKGEATAFCSDHWRVRMTGTDGQPVTHKRIAALLDRVASAGLDFIKTEHLCQFDGEAGYSGAHG